MKGTAYAVKPAMDLTAVSNYYALLGKVSITLEEAGLLDREREFVSRAVSVSSYGELLTLSQEYVEFKPGDENERSTD